ncbi:hypothetical protein E3E22_10530 [Thermococcus sp. MV5]|uniref:hypothetical protein n=1 Tax=Thermococcus sp. MV5 TaxID=1638272 RepID=UPI0014395BFC|nr:hypothetical protein [Thermococcus sp. MV5]NJE27036.1 hypothetical protein [Thermococcus sp. MV5]
MEFWDIKYIGYKIYNRDTTKREHEKILRELKRFLTMNGLNYKDFYKWTPGQGKQYFIPTRLAERFIEYYKKGLGREKELIINEEYFKTQKSIKERLKEVEKELAKVVFT